MLGWQDILQYFGPQSTWSGGKEKAPAAMCRKVAECKNEIEVWEMVYKQDHLCMLMNALRQH